MRELTSPESPSDPEPSTLSDPDATRAWSDKASEDTLPQRGRKDNHDVPPPGTHLEGGRYAILEEIARGEMGSVLRGHDFELNREVAVKVLRSKYLDEVNVSRFFDEAQIGGQLQHPGIVPIYDLGTLQDERPYFAMKLVVGRTLGEILAERGSHTEGLPRLLTIFEQVAQTVAYAHSREVIHRDLKPSNVMVGAFGEVQVVDWGLAKVLSETREESDLRPNTKAVSKVVLRRGGADPSASMTGFVMGTPAYMAPEQARGETELVDERSDVFGLGAILCQILTGQPPFIGGSGVEMVRKSQVGDLSEAYARLNRSGAEPELIAIAKRCIASERNDRPRDATVVASEITAHLAGVQERLRASELGRVEAQAKAEAEQARAESQTIRAEGERARRKMTVALASAILLAGLVGGGSWLAFRIDREKRLAESDRLVAEALASAEALRVEAERAGPDAVVPWDHAYDAADKARSLLAARPARESLARDVERVYATSKKQASLAVERANADEADRKLVAELEEARLEVTTVKDGNFDVEGKRLAYAKSFRDAGIDFANQSPVEIQSTIRAKRDPKRIAAAIDDWWSDEPDPGLKKRLREVAGAIDPGRDRLRDAIERGDRPALVEMANDPAFALEPSATICLLAHTLNHLGAADDAITLLNRARLAKPEDFFLNHDLGLLFFLHHRDDPDQSGPRIVDALRSLTVAVALRPDSAGVRLNLSTVLMLDGRHDEAIAGLREAIKLNPGYASAHNNLSHLLIRQRKFTEAEAEAREAIRLNPGLAEAHTSLGYALGELGKRDDQIAAFRESARLKPGVKEIHYVLGAALLERGDVDEASTHLEKAAELGFASPQLSLELGKARLAKGNEEGALAAYREALRLSPNVAEIRVNLAGILLRQGDQSEAQTLLLDSVRLNPDLYHAHYNLGLIYAAQGKHTEAIAAYKEAIRCDPKQPDAHCNLGLCLREKGRYSEALAELREGHRLGMLQPVWTYPSGQWVKECEALAAMERRLPAVLRGEDQPRDNAERVAFGKIAFANDRFAAAAKLWGEAMDLDPKLAVEEAGLRYNAACVAIQAGTGKGKDDPVPDETTRAALRERGKKWLAAELTGWKRAAMTAGAQGVADRAAAAKTLTNWKNDPDLAGVRDASALAALPEPEREEWKAFWTSVDGILKKVRPTQ